MRRWISLLASLKLTVAAVLLLGVVLSWGTILESLRGAKAARAVYGAWWFYGLLGVFALNVLCALVERWPRNRWRVGFAITHVSMLVILLGALMTLWLKVEGRMPIPEEGRTNQVFREGEGGKMVPLQLPFEVRLTSFEIDTYPGTRRPSQFRSRVVVVDPAQPGETAAVIEMNRPFSHGGYTFFQSSYQIEEGRETTVLAVSRDPGQPVVFVGYTFLVIGMIVVLSTRIAQYRIAAAEAAAAAAPLLLLALLAPGRPAEAAAGAGAVDLGALRAVPVQYDGRTMPLDTQARNDVWTVTGRRGWPGVDPVEMVVGWATDPSRWASQPIVRVKGDVAAAVGLPPGTRFASFEELVGNEKVLEAIRAARRRSASEEKPSRVDRHLQELDERLQLLYGYFTGEALRAAPAADPGAAWGALRPRSAGGLVDAARFLRSNAPKGYPSEAEIAREVRYNAVRPSRVAWLVLLPAAFLAMAAVSRPTRLLEGLSAVFLVGGLAVMTWGLSTRWQVAGRIPASDMYESMLFLAWGVGVFGLISVLLRNRILVANAAGASALAMLLVDLLPMDPFIHPMPPVLSGTPWLAIHVPIIMVSYSVFALATVLAHLVVGVEVFAPARRDLSLRFSELIYWYLHAGSILLIAGILTGSIWAASSWGRYWGWDPKEVWSLVAFLAYMAILHARSDGQISDFGVAAGSIAAFGTILMTYLGVNYVLAAGLHSYGFGSSNLVLVLVAVFVVETLFLWSGWTAVRRRRLATLPAAPAGPAGPGDPA